MPLRSPRAHEVCVEIRAAAVNRLDLDLRAGVSGFELTSSHQLGREGSGIVTKVGAAVKRWSPGDRVIISAYPPCGDCGHCHAGRLNLCQNPRRPGIDAAGTYAQYLVVPSSGLFRLPDELDFVSGACLQLTFGTAWHGLITRGALRPHETALITGAGGGVGSAAVQVASLAGARVIAAAGTQARRDLALRCGADEAIDSSAATTMVEHVMSITGGRGVDLIFDAGAGQVMQHAPSLAAVGGRYVLYGAHESAEVQVNAINIFRRYMQIIATRGWFFGDMRNVISAAAAKRVSVPVEAVLPLGQAALAHDMLEKRRVAGKLVLVP